MYSRKLFIITRTYGFYKWSNKIGILRAVWYVMCIVLKRIMTLLNTFIACLLNDINMNLPFFMHVYDFQLSVCWGGGGSSQSRMFHTFGNVIFTDEGLQTSVMHILFMDVIKYLRRGFVGNERNFWLAETVKKGSQTCLTYDCNRQVYQNHENNIKLWQLPNLWYCKSCRHIAIARACLCNFKIFLPDG